jgi:hypothetical protein|tara:strand:+ start:764 stop:1318 length:555 start_codon:yes stop_codon:yes gene_type:complete
MLHLKPIILKHLTLSVIAPHGITDIVHGKQEDKINNLLITYSGTVGTSYLLSSLDLDSVINFTFFILSIVHFRRDMPEINGIPKYVWSFLFLQFCIMNSPNLFFLYMVFMHVPHHYKLNWNYIKKDKKLSLSLILFSTLIIEMFGQNIDIFNINESFMSVIKGIIMSHVIYEEMNIFEQEKIDF